MNSFVIAPLRGARWRASNQSSTVLSVMQRTTCRSFCGRHTANRRATASRTLTCSRSPTPALGSVTTVLTDDRPAEPSFRGAILLIHLGYTAKNRTAKTPTTTDRESPHKVGRAESACCQCHAADRTHRACEASRSLQAGRRYGPPPTQCT